MTIHSHGYVPKQDQAERRETEFQTFSENHRLLLDKQEEILSCPDFFLRSLASRDVHGPILEAVARYAWVTFCCAGVQVCLSNHVQAVEARRWSLFLVAHRFRAAAAGQAFVLIAKANKAPKVQCTNLFQNASFLFSAYVRPTPKR